MVQFFYLLITLFCDDPRSVKYQVISWLKYVLLFFACNRCDLKTPRQIEIIQQICYVSSIIVMIDKSSCYCCCTCCLYLLYLLLIPFGVYQHDHRMVMTINVIIEKQTKLLQCWMINILFSWLMSIQIMHSILLRCLCYSSSSSSWSWLIRSMHY